MDLGIIITATVLITICTIPFVLSSRSSSKKEKELLILLKNLAEKQNCKITQHEVLGCYAIGVDEAKKVVFFYLKTEEIINLQYINLEAVSACQILNIKRSNVNNEKVIDLLKLKFSFLDKSKSDIILEFYSSKISYQLIGELKSIERWYKLINELLSSK